MAIQPTVASMATRPCLSSASAGKEAQKRGSLEVGGFKSLSHSLSWQHLAGVPPIPKWFPSRRSAKGGTEIASAGARVLPMANLLSTRLRRSFLGLTERGLEASQDSGPQIACLAQKLGDGSASAASRSQRMSMAREKPMGSKPSCGPKEGRKAGKAPGTSKWGPPSTHAARFVFFGFGSFSAWGASLKEPTL